MVHLSLKNIKKYYGGNLILKNISFDILMGAKVGVLGRNGTGKTTLFKLINQIEKQDEGNIAIKKDTTIGYLDQIPVFHESFKVKDVLDTAFEKEFTLLKEMKDLELTMAEATSPAAAPLQHSSVPLRPWSGLPHVCPTRRTTPEADL